MPASPAPLVPVEVGLREPLGWEVAAYVEAELGWQVVPAGGPPPPALRLVGLDGAAAGAVVVVEGEPGEQARSSAGAAGALAVLGWPRDRQRLPELVGRARQQPGIEGPPVVRVAGVGGGVGTSTVTLAIAGLLAWSSARVIAVGGDGLCRLCGLAPWAGPGALEVAALDASQARHEVEVLARPVRGVAGLRALGGGPVADALGWAADVVVVDVGKASTAAVARDGSSEGNNAVDVLVAAPDGRLATASATVAPVLLCGDGPLDDRAAARLLGRAPAGRLPRSARVARAGLEQRVPAGLPGSWLRALSDALGSLDGPVR